MIDRKKLNRYEKNALLYLFFIKIECTFANAKRQIM